VHRSFFLASVASFVHVAAAICLFLPDWPVVIPVVGSVFLLISGIFCWRQCWPKIQELRLLADGRLECRLQGEKEFLGAELQPGATVHPALTLLRLVCEGRRLSVALLQDSATAEDRRRLRVWLRWRASFGRENADSDSG